jgi:hypothetical protein
MWDASVRAPRESKRSTPNGDTNERFSER